MGLKNTIRHPIQSIKNGINAKKIKARQEGLSDNFSAQSTQAFNTGAQADYDKLSEMFYTRDSVTNKVTSHNLDLIVIPEGVTHSTRIQDINGFSFLTELFDKSTKAMYSQYQLQAATELENSTAKPAQVFAKLDAQKEIFNNQKLAILSELLVAKCDSLIQEVQANEAATAAAKTKIANLKQERANFYKQHLSFKRTCNALIAAAAAGSTQTTKDVKDTIVSSSTSIITAEIKKESTEETREHYEHKADNSEGYNKHLKNNVKEEIEGMGSRLMKLASQINISLDEADFIKILNGECPDKLKSYDPHKDDPAWVKDTIKDLHKLTRKEAEKSGDIDSEYGKGN